MKISRIQLSNYNQFKNVDIDLTYPQGHPKQGLPLEKVCFIGQSGTGKTTVLNLIRQLAQNLSDGNVLNQQKTQKQVTIGNVSNQQKAQKQVTIKFNVCKSKCFSMTLKENSFVSTQPFDITLGTNAILEKVLEIEKLLIYFSTNLDEKVLFLRPKANEKRIIVTQADIETAKLEREKEYKQIIETKILHSNAFKKADFWSYLLHEFEEYDKLSARKNAEFIKKASNESIEKILSELKSWKEKNQNPRELLGDECLDGILSRLGVKINREWSENGEIKLQHANESEIPFEFASSGTKRVILTSLPLYLLETKNSLILFDEVENSLYPDIQRTIIEHYRQLAPEAQFFYASHSPIIATSFEPWEIVELKLSENGYIYQEKYFKDERCVDNYFIQPQYLRWDSIFQRNEMSNFATKN